MRWRIVPFLLSLLSCTCLAQAKAIPEYTMKAAYLYNFAQLTEWPSRTATSGETFNLCVFGQEQVAAALEPMRGRRIGGRPLKPVQPTDPAEARQCHLLYIGEADGFRGIHLVEALRGTPVLTVTDDRLVARYGAMLLIVAEGRRLVFDVNLDAAKRSQINFSSKLLRLANRVTGE
jgi:hypothetical protein